MSNWQLKTPIAFLIFNRPETTQKVFETIRQAKPPKLLVVADGPRLDKPGETEKCKAVRRIIEQVDWECEVLKNYSDLNLGCKKRVSSGLSWVFHHAEEAIILEDDCLPHPSFFQFCEELLNWYRNDNRIMMISGNNFQYNRRRSQYSYYFSRYNHIWGWASWSRAWKYYDVNMNRWPEIRDGNWLVNWLEDEKSIRYWRNAFEKSYQGDIDTWDHQWTFICWIQGALSIIPNVNLVSNIGFGQSSTHTSGKSNLANIASQSMEFPLSHPPDVIRDTFADRITTEDQFSVKPLLLRIINKFKNSLYEL